MKKIKNISVLIFIALFMLFASACNNNSNQQLKEENDSLAVTKDTANSSIQQTGKDTTTIHSSPESTTKETIRIAEKPIVLIYNFHITNRCAACIAIEEATTKTLNTYFTAEVKQGRIKRQILNVDEDANKTVSVKYQAFGSSLFVTKIFNGKETITDLTGDGFKYAKNKEEKFIGILKETINNALKP